MPDLAVGLVPPAYLWVPPHVSTAGDEAVDLADAIGIDLDEEQKIVVRALLATRADGHWAAFEVAVIKARQNGKTLELLVVAIYDLFVGDANLIVWTAHLFDTAQEAFRDAETFIGGTPFLSREVKHVHHARGDEGIELHNGRRLNFMARGDTSGRGMTGDRVVLDEAFALSARQMGALLPTLSARRNPQVVYASSAGLLSSDMLRSIRNRGRRGGDPSLAYVEWASEQRPCPDPHCDHHLGSPGCLLDSPAEWQKANPKMGRVHSHGISEEHIEAERRALGEAWVEFARERLGWWEDPPPVGNGDAFSEEAFLALADPEATRGTKPVFGVDVGEDRLAHVAVAWRRRDGRVHVMLAATGLSPLVTEAEVKRLAGEWKGRVMLGGTSADLAVPQSKAVSGIEFAAACGRFGDLVTERRLRHGNQPELNEAVRQAKWRSAGAAGQRAIQLKDMPAVGPLAAVVRALHGLLSVPQTPPAAPQNVAATADRSDTADLATAGF